MKRPPSSATVGAPPVHAVWPLQAQLGEGPIWLAAERALWFVDIEGRRVHRYSPDSGATHSSPMPGRPSFLAPLSDGHLLLGMDLALLRLHADGSPGATVAQVGGDPHCRTNDATVDPQGRLWFGTMDLAQRAPIGQVHVFDGQTVRAVGGHCPITNGPAVSPDGAVLYHVDTLGGLIWAFAIDGGVVLEHGRLFATIDPADGTPDGVTIDADGALWVALWGGWCVRRYSPAGELLLTVPMPCAQVTKVAFGGDDLRTAFVTTARIGLSEAQLTTQPLAGALLAFASPVPGLPANVVRMP